MLPIKYHLPSVLWLLTLLVGRQEGHPACKKYGIMRCWRGYLSGARCNWFAILHMVQLMPLPPHHLLLQQNLEWFILLVLAYLGCPGKRLLKFVCVCVPIKYHQYRQYQSLSVFLNITFAVWNPCHCHTSRNIRHVNYNVLTHKSGVTSELRNCKNFSCSQAVTYNLQVATSLGWYKIETLLLYSSSSNSLSNSGSSDDLEWSWRSFTYCKPFRM